jgi:hypothetical protein
MAPPFLSPNLSLPVSVQFVESECEVLPSKERCPYLVVAEMIEQPFTSKSEEIYTQGAYVRTFIAFMFLYDLRIDQMI